MTDLQATLDAIDELAVHECGHCQRPLNPDGASPDFCGPWCQEAWLRAKQEVVELVGYREPYDLPQHVDNLTEWSSPETSSQTGDMRGRENFSAWLVAAAEESEPFRASFAAALTGLGDFMTRYRAQIEYAGEQVCHFGNAYFRVVRDEVADDGVRLIHEAEWLQGASVEWTVHDEIHVWPLRGLEPLRAMSFAFREEPEPQSEPCETTEPFGSDFDFEHRPATTVPDTSPAAVMPALPDRDWQAIVDAHLPSSGPERRARAPREQHGSRR